MPMQLSCIIVEDEPIAAEILKGYVAQISELNCQGVFCDAEHAYEFLRSNPPVDVVFLDIQMPGMTGLDLLKLLKYKPKLIFTTAHRDYAIQAFELQVIDYLLKPVSFERFLTAINRLLQPIFKAEQAIERASQMKEYYFFSVGKRSVKIYLEDINYIESMNDVVYVRTDHQSYETKYPLAELELILPTDRFLRVHRSYIIHLRQVKGFSATEVYLNQRDVPIGRSYKQLVLLKLTEVVHGGK
jgi:DNA-binding LytR/AlgR family response regulator